MQSAIISNEQAAHDIFNQYFGDSDTTSGAEIPPNFKATQENKKVKISLEDEEIIKMATAASNGLKFNQLWSGDISGYKSHSEADLALCQILAFWSGNNPDQIDRLFRQSGLYRHKWDENRGSQTYGEKTIVKAIKRTTETYDTKGVNPDAGYNENVYFSNDSALFWNKKTKDGIVHVKLANFSAKICREVILDDGKEKTIHLEMAATLRERKYEFQIPASRFHPMNWPTEVLGAMAIVEPGQALKDRTRCAIQAVSGDIDRHEVFIHTGWRETSSGWIYLHAEGALGESGKNPDFETDLGPLSNFSIPELPSLKDTSFIISKALGFFRSLPECVGITLFLAPFMAVLSEADYPDFSIHMIGPTGVFKSELAAIVQSNFGPTMSDKRKLPASWSSTGNSLERMAFLAKDSVLTIDDYAPNGTSADIARKQRDAEHLFRSAGNHHGRGRMNADGSLRPTNYPRGLIVSTGEDMPWGHSLRARLLSLEIEAGKISSELLSQGQILASEGILNKLTAAFICWCAGKMKELKEKLPKRRKELRQSLKVSGHTRLPDTIAQFMATAEIFTDFAQEVGAFDEEDGKKFTTQCALGLRLVGEQQYESLESEDVCQRFFSLLASVLSSGRGHLLDQTFGNMPSYGNLSNFGWHESVYSPETNINSYAGGRPIGWVNEKGDLYLNSENAFAEVCKLAREQGHPFAITQGRLKKTLKDKNFLQSYEDGRTVVKVNIVYTRRRVLHLHLDQVFPPGDLMDDMSRSDVKNDSDHSQPSLAREERWENV